MSPQLRAVLQLADGFLHPDARAVPAELWRGRILVLGLAMGAALTLAFLVTRITVDGLSWQLGPLGALTGLMVGLFCVVGRTRSLERIGDALILALAVLIPLNGVWGPGAGLGTLACVAILPTLATYYTGPQARKQVLLLLTALLLSVLVAVLAGADFVAARPSRLGAVLTVLAIAASVWMAHVIGILNEERDREALAKLGDSEGRHALAIRATGAGVLEWDPNSGKCLLSERLEAWLGLPASPNGLHSPHAVLEALPRDAAAALARSVAEPRTDGQVISVETRTGQGPRLRWLRWDALTEQRPQGFRVVALVRDVTEEHRVSALHENFLATVSHELRTPLTTIQGALSLLRANAAGELNAEARGLVERAAHANTRLSGLVEDLLNLRDLDEGQVHPRSEPVEIAALISAVAAPHLEYARSRGVRLEALAHAVSGVSVESDPELLALTLDHLILNAAQFTRPNSTVTVRAELERGSVLISVSDEGPGVPDSFLPRLFTRFSQASPGADRDHGGIGVGLAVARGLVQRLGGEIGYRPAPEQGSTFWVKLPLPAAEVAAPDRRMSVA